MGNDDAIEQAPIVAMAMSRNRTVAAQVDSEGFVVGVRLFKDEVRSWSSRMLGDRVVAVAAVAHDRYLANNPDPDRLRPSLTAVAASERNLDF